MTGAEEVRQPRGARYAREMMTGLSFAPARRFISTEFTVRHTVGHPIGADSPFVTAPLLDGQALAARTALVLSVPLQAALGAQLLNPATPADGLTFLVGALADGGAGGAHAGALAVGFETAALLALLPQLTEAEHAITISTATTLSTAAPVGARIEFRGELDRRTGRTAFTSVLATCHGAPIARAQVVKAVVPMPDLTTAGQPTAPST